LHHLVGRFIDFGVVDEPVNFSMGAGKKAVEGDPV
jgi:hypothetical protein